MADCTGCDCVCIHANINYYSAAITVDQAALTVAQNQLSADQTAYYYWQYQSYMCGCGSMRAAEGESPADAVARPSVPPVTAEQFKSILDNVNRMRDEYKVLLGNYQALLASTKAE